MAEFDWNNYLETNKSSAIPEELFSHVEASLFNGIKQGMLLEVCHTSNPDLYWIAEITMVCGHLLRIKFIGAESDFWCDMSNTKVHPLGWCGKHEENIEPPEEINNKYGDTIIEIMKSALAGGQSASLEDLNNKGLSPIDRIKTGMKVEVQNIIDPYRYWIATVCENVGGRLLLRYDGADDDLQQFWIFCTNPRLCVFGFVTNKAMSLSRSNLCMLTRALTGHCRLNRHLKVMGLTSTGECRFCHEAEETPMHILSECGPLMHKRSHILGSHTMACEDASIKKVLQFLNVGSPWQFKYPGKVNKFSCKNKLSTQLRQSAEESIKEPTPADLFKPNLNIQSHDFSIGMKLEALDPQDMKHFRPATVIKIFNNLYFLVTIDDHIDDYEETKMAWLCDSMNPYIYPIGWSKRHNLPFKVPKAWKDGPFDWNEYLTLTNSAPAPDYCFGNKEPLKGIEVNMKLEAVNPLNQEEVHVASIDAIVEHMVCVELLPIGEKFWYSQDSDLLFPVGWCDSNNYELHIPDLSSVNDASPTKPEETKRNIEDERKKPSEEWCDRIFFNYKCYAGPSISRNKLSQLPKHVGPGPFTLVLKEVLNKIISASYKPAKLLKDWESEGPPEEGMRLEMLRAKLKTSTYHAYVPIATRRDQLEAFCRSVCVRLQACPSLFGPGDYPDRCPHHCQAQEKSSFHNGTERRGRPKGSVNGRKKKRKIIPEKKEPQPSQESEMKDGESVESEHSNGSSPPSEGGTRPNSPDSLADDKRSARRKREPKNNYPKLEMKTRGAKLPNFALQMKEAHWNKKDVETIYNNTCVTKKQSSHESDTENETNASSINSRDAKQISDVSDSEEPELKKLKFTSYDPLPTDNKMFEKNTAMFWHKGKLKLNKNPLEWSVDDVHDYLSNTEDCKLIADKMRQEEIDGQAFVMLDMPIITDFLHLKKEFASLLCKHIMNIRWYYMDNFDNNCET